MPNANSVSSVTYRSSPVTSIERAAAATGVDFDYLVSQAEIESAMNPNAKAGTSSAAGLFQFTQQTWLATVEKHGHKAGLEWAQDAIQRDKNGSYYVANPTTRKIIMDLRFEPEPASRMAAYFALDNQAYLRSRLGIEPTSTDLYLAHFLGAGGAVKFLSEMSKNPNALAASIFPEAASANRNIFYTKSGTPRSLAQVYGLLHEKLDKAGDKWVPGGFEPNRQPIMYANAPSLGPGESSSNKETEPAPNQIAAAPIPVPPMPGTSDNGTPIAFGPTKVLPIEDGAPSPQVSPNLPNQTFPISPTTVEEAYLSRPPATQNLYDFEDKSEDVVFIAEVAKASAGQIQINNPNQAITQSKNFNMAPNKLSFSTIEALASIRFEPMPKRLSIDFARATYSRLAQV